MKPSEVRTLSDKELRERIFDLKKTLTQLRLNHAVTPLENPMQIPLIKKDIARLMTEMRQREFNRTVN